MKISWPQPQERQTDKRCKLLVREHCLCSFELIPVYRLDRQTKNSLAMSSRETDRKERQISWSLPLLLWTHTWSTGRRVLKMSREEVRDKQTDRQMKITWPWLQERQTDKKCKLLVREHHLSFSGLISGIQTGLSWKYQGERREVRDKRTDKHCNRWTFSAHGFRRGLQIEKRGKFLGHCLHFFELLVIPGSQVGLSWKYNEEREEDRDRQTDRQQMKIPWPWLQERQMDIRSKVLDLRTFYRETECLNKHKEREQKSV